MPRHDENKPVCGICQREFARKDYLKDHMKAEHEGKRIPCEYEKCSKTFVNKQARKRHAQKEHEGRRWVCSECGKALKSPNGLKRHEATHKGTAQFPCPEGCGRSFAQKQDLEKHVKADHEGLRFICEQEGCGRQFKYESSLKAHIKSDHQGIKDHVCETCGEKFSSKSHLTRHASTHGEKIPCPEGCGSEFARADYLQQHIDADHHGNYFHCEEVGCDRKYKARNGLVQHMKDNHEGEGEIFRCNQCGKELSTALCLTHHEKYIHGELSFPCKQPGCNCVFNRPYDLQKHIFFVHVKISFFCGEDGCDETFDEPCSLENHVKSVHGGKTYPCHHKAEFDCNEIFTSRWMATYHSSTHYLWICNFPRCMANLQQKRMSKSCASKHYRGHIERGQCLEGEFKPLKVSASFSLLNDECDLTPIIGPRKEPGECEGERYSDRRVSTRGSRGCRGRWDFAGGVGHE